MCDSATPGIGIDPSYQPARTPPKMAGQDAVHPDLYSEKLHQHRRRLHHVPPHARHIGQTSEFIAMIRRAIGIEKTSTVLFELPDAVRVLKDTGFLGHLLRALLLFHAPAP